MGLSIGLILIPSCDAGAFKGGGNICPAILCQNEIYVYEPISP